LPKGKLLNYRFGGQQFLIKFSFSIYAFCTANHAGKYGKKQRGTKDQANRSWRDVHLKPKEQHLGADTGQFIDTYRVI